MWSMPVYMFILCNFFACLPAAVLCDRCKIKQCKTFMVYNKAIEQNKQEKKSEWVKKNMQYAYTKHTQILLYGFLC